MDTLLGLIFGLVAGLGIGLVLAAFIGYFVVKRQLANVAARTAAFAKDYALEQLKERGPAAAQRIYEVVAKEHGKQPKQPSPEDMWQKFIEHLNVVNPLGKHDEVLPHKSFIGSIDSYRKIFIEANKKDAS